MSDLTNMEMEALNFFINKLLCDPRPRWIIAYCATTNTYQLNADNVAALPIVNYMRRNDLKTLLNFTLDIEDDSYSSGCSYYILKIDQTPADSTPV